MNIKEAKEQIKNAMTAYFSKDAFGNYIIPIQRQRPIFLIGPPGIGKTAIMEQIAQEINVGLVSYSMTHHTRQSALGLPLISQKTYGGKAFVITEYTMSEIIASIYDLMEETGFKEGILFLDEINCVSETLAPSMLQFLQYKIFGKHQIPNGWIVVTAGNPPEYNKSVREYDIVTWDRLKRIDVEPDYPAWKEYAYKKGIHGSIMTFLELKKEMFYSIQTTVEGKSFVTARAWEDLSEMIKLYEINDIPVDLNLVGQYLQNKKVSKEYSIYYDLYNKYKSDFQVDSILSGEASEETKRKAEAAPFDERLALLGLLLDSITSDMKEVILTDLSVQEILHVLKGIKLELLSSNEVYVKVLNRAIEREEKILFNGIRSNSISQEDRFSCQSAIHALKRNLRQLIRENLPDNTAVFQFIKKEFDQSVIQLKERMNDVNQKISNAFAFLEEVYQEGHEMLVFITELTMRYYCAKYISQYGCPDYFRHNKELLFYQRQQELLSQIKDLEEL